MGFVIQKGFGVLACDLGINSSRRGLFGGEKVVVETCGGWWSAVDEVHHRAQM